ncbi:hypothetical protein [Devosia sp.]|uniref:hypothetical protein n=1 Tax=Devosia sp. TaxID=1871048 RepID=UPI0025D280DD|nr:hypothetical protein [Devosia sp.]MCR6636670.1 hypothetical protein [Devosia sp.]
MSQTTLTVLEAGKPLSYTYAELMHYHGFGFPGGVAHAFKVMERALPLLANGEVPERREIAIRTPFKGPGARDAFEMVTRSLTEGRYMVNPELAQPERGETLKGYVFILSYRGTDVRLRIRDGIVRDEFIALGRKPDRTAEEDHRLEWLKQDMADRLLSLPADEIYDLF